MTEINGRYPPDHILERMVGYNRATRDAAIALWKSQGCTCSALPVARVTGENPLTAIHSNACGIRKS